MVKGKTHIKPYNDATEGMPKLLDLGNALN